ncbi:MAG: RNA polymerase sigma factor [Bacteroidota bacterium]
MNDIPARERVVTAAVPSVAHTVEHAVEETFRKERKRLLAFIRRRIPEPDDAEDILQDVFYQLLERLEPIEQVTAWLFRVARNKIIDRYRKRKTESLEGLMISSKGEDEPARMLDWILDPNGNPEDFYERSMVWEHLADALAELPKEQREAFVLHELEGKSFKEMAEETGVSINTMLSRKRYAILHLRERLQHLYNDLFKQ